MRSVRPRPGGRGRGRGQPLLGSILRNGAVVSRGLQRHISYPVHVRGTVFSTLPPRQSEHWARDTKQLPMCVAFILGTNTMLQQVLDCYDKNEVRLSISETRLGPLWFLFLRHHPPANLACPCKVQ